MNQRFRHVQATLVSLAIISAFGGGCSSVQPSADLAKARANVAQIRGDPVVARHAAPELQNAEDALRRAEAAWADKHDMEQTRHLAYLAQQRAAIASNVGTSRQIEESIAGLGAERERLRADLATAAAATAQQKATTAQQQVSQAQQQASQAQQQAAAQTERAAALQRELEQMEAKTTQRGLILTLPDVLFATGSATLQPGALRIADRLASILQQYPERRIMIEGFTDSVGNPEMNMDLSRRRADAFRQALNERGISADRIQVQGYGESYPIADNSTPSGRTQNRRIEILVSDAQGKLLPR